MSSHCYRVGAVVPYLAVLVLAACQSDDAVRLAPEVRCSGETGKMTPIVVAAGREIYCAIDLGSKNAKLQVISIEPGRPSSFEDERLCKSPLGFGAKVFDQKTASKGALPAADIADLVTVVRDFKQICAADQGTLVGAEATQWARDATNIAEALAAVKAGAAIDVEVLTPEQEGQYGHAAATRDLPERLSLDPGSNSFQIGWMEKGASAPRTISVPFGFVRAAAAHYPVTMTDSYDVARREHAAQLIERIDVALGALTPPTSIASLRKKMADGSLEPVIYVVGQDGALHLAVRALLRGADGRWVDTKSAYDERVAQEKSIAHQTFGVVTTVLTPAEIDAFFTNVVKPADFDALRQMPVRDLYGEKSLANAVLVDALIEQLGIRTVVLVPHEMPAGYILAKIAKR